LAQAFSFGCRYSGLFGIGDSHMDFVVGEKLTVWSNTEGRWVDAMVQQKAPRNSSVQTAPGAPPVEVAAGSILVSYGRGALNKWLAPSHFGTYALKALPAVQSGMDRCANAPPVFSSIKRSVRLPNAIAVAQRRHQETDDLSRAAVLQCDAGHIMFARVAREMFNVVRGSWSNTCDGCGELMDLRTDAFYRCRVCNIAFCMDCVHERLQRKGLSSSADVDPLLEVMAGDIFFFGPDHWGIHHTVLSRGKMSPANLEMVELLEAPDGAEVFECPTIESTQGAKGVDTEWYPATTYFLRIDGETVVVADLATGSDELQVAEPPVRLKVLLHPLRDGRFSHQAFHKAVDLGSETADKYGKRQAVKAFLAQALNSGVPEVIMAKAFPDMESRADLLEELHKCWEKRPICSALCIKVWQMYFEVKGQDAGQLDDAVRDILRWMPVYSDRTTPSALLQALTVRGWRLHQL